MNKIVLNKKNRNRLDVFFPTISDSIEKDRLNFIYNICPRWYNISDEEFRQYADYKIPMYQDEAFHCEIPSFYRKFGYRYSISSDTVVIIDSCLVLPKMVRGSGMSFFFLASNKKSKQMRHELSRSVSKDDAYFCSWIMDSYEYINYKVNYKRKVEFDVNSILGKQFTYLENLYKKESVHFVNDSVCMHVASKRKDVSSPYMPIAMDTCRYTTKNNLIAIDFYKDSPCDTLTYGNGILFYSKVYQDPRNKKYTHIVKPFIDENVKWESKSDSINMIMSTYFNVYVPINLLPHTISVADENNLQEIEQIKSLIVEDQKNRRLGAWIIEQSVSPLYIEAISDDGLYLYRYVSNSGNIAVIMLEDDNIADSMDYIEGLTDYEHKGYYEIVNDSMVNVIFDERYRNYCQPDETTEEANVYHIRGVHSYKFANMKWELIKADTAILQDERKQFCGEEILKYIYP